MCRLRLLVPACLAFLGALALSGAACSPASVLIEPGETGLRGQVLRGPIQPVCQEDEPCEDAPFAATFHVYRGARRVATFRSGDDGRFEVVLDPGTYTVVPDADAPLLAPEQQRQEVVVEADGVTEVTLRYDTGIR